MLQQQQKNFCFTQQAQNCPEQLDETEAKNQLLKSQEYRSFLSSYIMAALKRLSLPHKAKHACYENRRIKALQITNRSRQPRREGEGEVGARHIWGSPPSLKKIKCTRMRHFRKKTFNQKFFTEGPARMFPRASLWLSTFL